jgi:hypothetical protein
VEFLLRRETEFLRQRSRSLVHPTDKVETTFLPLVAVQRPCIVFSAWSVSSLHSHLLAVKAAFLEGSGQIISRVYDVASSIAG